tara:strand:+ start:37 stop:1305 length:1269 start_codon:yes stop_codon:yes gene_type:complete
MKKENLSEEIYRIRKLMNFDSENHRKNITSLDRLMEEDLRIQNILKEEVDNCTGNNEIDNVVVTVNPNPKNKNRYSFRISAFFPSTGSSDKIYGETLKTLKEQIFSNLDDTQKEKIKRGFLSISIMNITHIIGMASNYLNGPLVPTNWNNRSTMSGSYGGTVPKIKDKLKDKESSDWKKNLGYAKNRGNNFLKWINTSGVKEGITLNPNAKIPEAKALILDTGGCVDEKRDITKYKNPGQNLLVIGVVQLKPIKKEFTPEETEECLKGGSISIGYEPNGTHTCDFAIFNVYANNVLIGVANLNNGKEDVAGNITHYTNNRKSDGKKGGKRSTEFILNDEQITKIAKNSKDGRVSLSIKGFPSAWYIENVEGVVRGNTHSDTPTVVVKLNGKVRYSGTPQAKMVRTANPKKTVIYTFSPCHLI